MKLPLYLTIASIMTGWLLFAQLAPRADERNLTEESRENRQFRMQLERSISEAMELGDERGLALLKQAENSLPAGWSALDTSAGNLYHKTGVLCYINGDFVQAIRSFNKALPIRENHARKNVEPLLNTLNGLAQSHLQLLHYDSSESLLERQLSLMDQYDYENDETRADLYLADARLAYLIEDYTRCREKLLIAKELYEEIDSMIFNLGLTLNMLGVISDLLYEPGKAVPYYVQALGIFRFNQDPQYEALTLHNMGMAYVALSSYDKARACFDSSYRIHRLNCDSVELARYHVEMAKLESKSGSFDAAGDHAAKSLAIRMNALPDWHPDVLESQVVCGEIFCEQARSDTMLRPVLHKQAKMYFNTALTAAWRSPRSENAIIPLVSLAILNAENGRSDANDALQAHMLFLQADSIIQLSRLHFRHQESKMEFTRRVRSMYSHAIRNALFLHKASGDPAYFSAALTFSDRSKSTAVRDRLHKRAVQTYSGIPDSVLQLQRQLHLQLGASTQSLLSIRNQTDSVYFSGLKELEDIKYRMEELDEQMEKDFPRYYQWLREPQQQVDLKQLQQALNNGSVLLEYFIGENSIHVFGVSSDQYQHWEIADATAALATVKRCVESVEASHRLPSAEVQKVAYQTFELLLQKPVLFFGKSRDVKSLRIVPDGLIGKVPFDALLTGMLPDSKGELPYLIRQFSHCFLYSNRLLTDNQKPAGRKSGTGKGVVFGVSYNGHPALYGDSVYSPLPYIKEEVGLVASLNNAEVFMNEQATLERLKVSIEEAELLHIAVHGFVDESNPEASGLIFSKPDTLHKQTNILSLASIYGLSTNADFVYLSSCFSGTGRVAESEGVMSLSRAFTYAGAASQVITLWEVSDRASSLIAGEFYRQLKKGLEKDEALRQAKLRYLEECASAVGQTPFFWAGSVVVGNTEALYSGFPLYRTLTVLTVIILFLFWYRRRRFSQIRTRP
jgi:CHAT domain-containing protein